MESGGGRVSGNAREPLGPPRARGRACLVLSLIVLVWNFGVALRDAVFSSAPRAAGLGPAWTGASPPPRGAAAGPVGTADAVGGRAGPLSVRQRFLLGRTVDVNRARWEEISGLPGISDRVARAVVERRRLGPFEHPPDLLAVPGIKARRLKKILPFLSGFPNN